MVAEAHPELEVIEGSFFRRDRIIAALLAVLAIGLIVLIVRDAFFPAAPAAAPLNLYTVRTGNVRSSVTGTGTLVPMQQQSVGFRVSGTLTEVDVKVGDHVTAGQVLAKVDPSTYQTNLSTAQANLNTAQAQLAATESGTSVTQAQHSLDAANQSYSDTVAQVNLTNSQDAATVSTACSGSGAGTPACASAQNKQALDQLQGQHQINQATNAITNARDSLNNATINRQASVAQQQAAVQSDQNALNTAQQNLGYTTLTAPGDGTIMSLNGQVGDNVSASGSSSSSQAPGSSASLPSSTGGSSSTGNSAASSSSSGSGSGGSAFITLADLSQMEVVAPLAEGDAARVQPNQAITVTFDALTGLSIPGHVVAVASAATTVSNVTNYYVTFALDSLDQRLKSGMTANVSVVVSQASGVLVAPNSAIKRLGQLSYVTVLSADGKKQTLTPVQTGVAGDSGTTEITSGVSAGDRLVLPQTKVSSSSSSAGRGGGGGGLLGGGGGGGGGRFIGGGG